MVDLLRDLNEPQRQAVMHMDGPLLVLAGAGSGKTRVITRRVGHLVQQGIAPWNVLAITFTNKAAGEMARRIDEMDLPRGAMVATFHGLCARLLREFAAEAGLSSNYTIYDSADQSRLAKLVLDRCELPSGTFTPGKLLAGISRAKRQLKTAEVFAREARDFYSKHLAKAYTAYEEALSAAKAVDFDDLLMRMAFLLSDRLEVRAVLSDRFKYILIDEYQDTNHAQYIIAHSIALGHENICATGDPDQSIYGWRGADVANILEFEQDYPNAVVVRLEENYRSTAPILNAAGRLIANNRRRKEKALFTHKEGGSDVMIITAADEHAEAGEVVNCIRKLIAEGTAYQEIAVFYRLNSLSRVVEDALRKAAVPYRIARGVEFYNRKEIKDVLGYLKLLQNNDDEVACERIINVPSRGIGATTIDRLRDFSLAHGVSLFRAAQQVRQIDTINKSAAGKVEKFTQLVEQLSAKLDSNVKSIVEAVVDKSEMEAELRNAGGEDGSELANVAELISSAAEFDAEHENATLADYLNQVALVSDVDHMVGGNGAVTLMTLHAAKGLEFPAVFIVGCEQGLLPFERPDEPAEDSEEERRLCFVGITRAMQHLVLTHAKYRGLRGTRQRQVASPFLAEMGAENVRRIDKSGPELPERFRPRSPEFFEQEPWRQREEIENATAEDYEESQIQAELETQTDTGGIKAGCRVRHAMFGIGRVEKVAKVGPYTRAVVDFSQYGRKTLVLQYAKLEILG